MMMNMVNGKLASVDDYDIIIIINLFMIHLVQMLLRTLF